MNYRTNFDLCNIDYMVEFTSILIEGVGIATKLDLKPKKVIVKAIDVVGTGLELGVE